MRRIVINGKFLSQKQTGVQRVAHALTTELMSRTDMETVIAPAKGDISPWGRQIGAPNLRGVFWEQLELPGIAGKDLLLSLCNVAPVVRKGDIVMIHDAQAFISPQSYSTAFRTYYQNLLPLVASRAARVLTVSHYAAQCLAEVGVAPAGKIDVVHNGVDHILKIDRDNAVLSRLKLLNGPYVCALGSVQHHKNIKTIIKAAETFKEKSAKLVLIGAASREDYAAAGIALGENVCLAGRLSDQEMRSVVESASAFLFPSLTEGFGLPPLEAMLLGTPAIVAPCGAMPELCGDAAIYCEAESPLAWADAVNNVLADNLLQAQYSNLGKKKAGDYTWAASGDRLAGILLNYL